MIDPILVERNVLSDLIRSNHILGEMLLERAKEKPLTQVEDNRLKYACKLIDSCYESINKNKNQ